MIKRPIVWCGLAYVFGEILAMIIRSDIALLCYVIIVIIGIICILTGRIRKKRSAGRLTLRTCTFFCVLSVFLFCGSYRYINAFRFSEKIWSAGDDKVAVSMDCVVENIEKNGETYHVCCLLEDGAYAQLPIKMMIVSKQKPLYSYGDRLRVCGRRKRFERARNMGTYDAWENQSAKGIYYEVIPEKLNILEKNNGMIKSTLLSLKNRLQLVYYELLDARTAGVLCGIIFGDKQGMDPELKALYQSQGIGHLFAISGLHMSMAGIGIYRFLRKLTVPIKVDFIVTLMLMGAYTFVCGTPVSCVRAMIMAVFLMAAELLGKTYDSMTALFVAAICILWKYPLYIKNFGVLMSFSAVVVLIWYVPMLLSGISIKRGRNLVATLCVTMITTPIVAWFMYEIPGYNVFLNIVLLPLLPILFPLAAIGGIVGMFWIFGGRLLIGLVYYILRMYEFVCGISKAMPESVIVTGRPSMFVMIFTIIGLPMMYFLIIRLKRRYVIMFGLAFLAAVYILLGVQKPLTSGRVVFVDVGQGDCAIVSMSDGTHWMIDGGSSSKKLVGQRVIEKVLKYYGIDHLDGVFCSHMDSDHVNGIMELLESGYRIERLYVPAVCPDEEKLIRLKNMAYRHHTRVYSLKAGDRIRNKAEWCIECLHPSAVFKTDDDNEASMVLLIYIEGFKMLFTGDAEELAEKEMLCKLTDVDLLKAGHHGSKYSSGDMFLQRLLPEAAIISCGINNRYGHPHKETLERLKSFGCKTMITAQEGAIVVEISHCRFRIRSFFKSPDKMKNKLNIEK